MKNGFISAIFAIFSFYSFSQNTTKIIDSLKQELTLKPQDSAKIKIYSDLCWYYGRVNIDSAFNYGNRALTLSKKANNLKGEAQAYNDIGILHYSIADYESSLGAYQKSLKIRYVLKDSLGLAAIYNKIGLVHQNTFKLDSAIFYATKALKIYEDKNNFRYATVVKNNIANIYKGLKQYKKALEAHLEIAKINEDANDNKSLVKSYNNIANAYLFLNDTLNSIVYYKKGINLAETNNYNQSLAALYNNYGGVLHSKKEFAEAAKLVSKSLEIRKQLNDNFGVASTSLHLAGLYLDLKVLDKVENHLNLGLKLSEQFNANELKIDAYDKLASYHAYKKNADSVIYYKERFKTVKDSVFSIEVAKAVANIQEKYNTVEREKEIFSQRTALAEKELRITQKNTQILGLGVLALVLSVLGYLLYNQQKLKNQQLKKESELKEALVKIETQNKLQEQRLRISRDLHDNIGAQLTFIISSIENLQFGFKIKNEQLSNKLHSISAFTRATIYELRDTIWAMNKNGISLEDLQARISNFIDKAEGVSQGINFSFNVEKSVSKNLEFTSIAGMNIYRIIQESINNTIKHANAANVSVNIKKTKKKVCIIIQDDGIGFDKNKASLKNGLNNMKKRADEIGATFKIESFIDKGTTITLMT